MEAWAITLLKSNPTVQRLVIGWPKVERTAGFAFKDGAPKLSPALIRRWAAVAGVGEHEVPVWAPMLFAHDICLTDGNVDPAAKAFITRLSIAGLPKELRDELRKRDEP